ncbi:hypothetical protein [Brevibacterium antiquum]|nr:hypothetical protein [Brevibacterium antiquum]
MNAPQLHSFGLGVAAGMAVVRGAVVWQKLSTTDLRFKARQHAAAIARRR